MLSLDDPRWRTLHGGYRQPYDPTPALRGLAAEWVNEPAWEQLWNELHHQGDVGEASYAALTVIAELARRVPSRGWSVYALAATIETQRHARRNPPLPDWLADDYARAWATLAELALADLRTTVEPFVIHSALAVVALAKGATKLGSLIAFLDDSEIDEYLDERLAWSEEYRPTLDPPSRDDVRSAPPG
jgi:hypothetical protein